MEIFFFHKFISKLFKLTAILIGAFLMAQMVKHLSAMWETWVQSLGGEDPLDKEMATHSSTLVWKIPWTESVVGYSPWGCKESDMSERPHFCMMIDDLCHWAVLHVSIWKFLHLGNQILPRSHFKYLAWRISISCLLSEKGRKSAGEVLRGSFPNRICKFFT